MFCDSDFRRFSGPSARAWIGAAASTLASISNIKPRPEPLAPPSGSRISARLGIGGRLALLGQRAVRRQRSAGSAGLQDRAVGNRAGRHVENDRAVAARHRDRDRARSEACDARAMIGHEGRTGAHDHARRSRAAPSTARSGRSRRYASSRAPGRNTRRPWRALGGDARSPASSPPGRSHDRHRGRRSRRGPATDAAAPSRRFRRARSSRR